MIPPSRSTDTRSRSVSVVEVVREAASTEGRGRKGITLDRLGKDIIIVKNIIMREGEEKEEEEEEGGGER